MSGRRERDGRARMQVRGVDAGQARAGLRVGAVRVTPARVTLLIAFVGGLSFLGYSMIVRDQLQIPLMATGFAICGLVLAAMSVMGLAGVIRAGRDGRDGVAVVSALVAGLIAVASLLSLAAAVIMSLIWSGTKAS